MAIAGLAALGSLVLVVAGLSADHRLGTAPSTQPVSATQPAHTRPSTSPSTQPNPHRGVSSDDLLGQMFAPSQGSQARPIGPAAESGTNDRTSGPGAVKPAAPLVPTLREGTVILDRVGRLHRTPDGQQAELAFESDGVALKDPPMIIVPNLQLMSMENAVTGSSRDLRFRVTGTVTEYRGRNFLLLTKVLVVPDVTQQF